MNQLIPIKPEEIGTLMSLRSWIIALELNCFVPDDGSGCWATDKEFDDNSDVWNESAPDWATHVIWFNK